MAIITPITMWSDTISAGTATIDVPEGGLIKAVNWSVRLGGMDALGDYYLAHISFASTTQAGVNDARAVISFMAASQNFLTSGGGVASDKFISFGTDGIAVAAGERIYLHAVGATGVTATDQEVTIYFAFGRPPSRAATRRR